MLLRLDDSAHFSHRDPSHSACAELVQRTHIWVVSGIEIFCFEIFQHAYIFVLCSLSLIYLPD